MRATTLLAATMMLAACGRPQPHRDTGDSGQPATAPSTTPTSAATPSAPATGSFVEADYLGRWRGVEGMVLDVRKGAAPGRYALAMQWDLDHRGSFDAMPSAAGLAFTRDGEHLTLRRTDGAATGLKYLADKHDCLTVAPGEGYCRD